jgi:hypothetical protein
VQRLLGEVEVAEQADQSGENPARVGAVDGVHRFPHRPGRILARHPVSGYALLKVMIGRTSMLPRRADGIFEATWRASFKSLASMR